MKTYNSKSMAPIVLHTVSKAYGDLKALQNISLSFKENSTTAVIGPSGSGKSTLVQMINGLVRPDQGEVQVFEKPIDDTALPQLRLQIGDAVQGIGLFPHMTVWENITLLARLQNWTAQHVQDRGQELMQLVGLPHTLIQRYPHELSGGQQQRVGLCRAMMLHPPIFLLDEPFGALDPITRSEIHQEFLHLQKSEPQTIVLVTHDLREAMKLADHVVLLDQGMIVQQAPPEEIRKSPATDFVRKFVESQLEN